MIDAWAGAALVVLVVFGAVVAAYIIGLIVRRAGRRLSWMNDLSRRARRPFRFLAAAIAALVSALMLAPAHGWHIAVHVLTILVIAGGAWFVSALLFVLEDGALPRLRTDVSDNRRVRAVRTQVILLRRVTAVVIAVLAFAGVLLTFQEARVVGASLLASAGVAAAIAAFATNTLLGNVVAGLQIAFSGSLRLDDVVVVEGQWGRVDAITLTYVVVHIWDDRRLILPTSYFTTRPFENWTHTASPLLGEILMDVDWVIDLEPLRVDLHRMLSESSLWDGRVGVVQMVDAVGGNVTIRALVSASDAPTLWDLRCHAREQLVMCIRRQGAEPHARTEIAVAGNPTEPTRHLYPWAARTSDRVFSGDDRSWTRGASFKGPGHGEGRLEPDEPQ